MNIQYLEKLREEVKDVRGQLVNLEDRLIEKMEELQSYQGKCEHNFISKKCTKCGMSKDDYEDYMLLCHGLII